MKCIHAEMDGDPSQHCSCVSVLREEVERSRALVAELEVSLQALKEENAMLRDERRIDNEEAARLYDFARNKGEALERQAVVAWLRGRNFLKWEADAIERGEHRREEGA